MRIVGSADVCRLPGTRPFLGHPIQEVLVTNGSALTTPVTAAAGPPPTRALAFRRWVLIAAPVVAGLLAIGGAVADPAMDLDGAAMYEVYAAEPDAVQWKSLLYHFSYAVLGLAALMLAGAVRRRGSALANVAGFLGLLGISSIPGFLLIDFYDSAIGQVHGVEGTLAVERTLEPMWGLQVMVGTGMVGFLLCLPVAALAAWRGGLVCWWGAVAPIVGLGLGVMVVGANVLGWALMTLGFAVLSFALARVDRRVLLD